MNNILEHKIKNTCMIFPELVNDYFINDDTTIIDIIMKEVDDKDFNDKLFDLKTIRKDVCRYIITNYDVT